MTGDTATLSPPWATALATYVPAGVRAVYGARWVIEQGGRVDVVWDRCGFSDDGTEEGSQERRRLSDALFEDVGEGTAEELVGRLLRTGAMSTHQNGVVALHEGPRCRMIADPRGSAGYLYVAAWLSPESAA